MEEKQWKNEGLRKLEEALPRFFDCELEKVSILYKAKAPVGCYGFHPKVPGLDKRNEGRNRGVLGEGGTKWKVAATSMHDDVLLDTEEYHE